MDVKDLRFYARPFSEAESSWPRDVRARMKRRSMDVVRRRLGVLQLLKFGVAFARARSFTRTIDLTEFRARGLDDQTFIDTQLDYLAFFIALKHTVGLDAAVEISWEVMDAASLEPMLLCLPEPDNVRACGEPFEVMTEYMRALPEASEISGCHEMAITEDSDDALQFDVSWCVWLELARAAGVPEACIANCHADNIAFPDYFADLGMTYRRTQTLACGGTCCDFRFERGDTA